MRLQINPPVVEIFPNDEQEFTAAWIPPTSGWAGVTDSGDIGGDFLLFVDGAGSQVTAFGAHQLVSGIGSVEWTIDDASNPSSTGLLITNGFITDVNGVQYLYSVRIGSTSIEVRDEAFVQIFTTAIAVASGDVMRLELNAGFRLYRTAVGGALTLLHSRVSLGSQVTYPMLYQMALIEPVDSGAARIPPPNLIGDGWRLRPVVDWTAPSHGSISTVGPGLKTRYFGGTVPGEYTLTGRISAANDAFNVQRATALIKIPAFFVIGNLTEVTLTPAQKVRFATNYDRAKTKLVSWAIINGGGSFTEEEFTAGALAGTSLVRATVSVNSQIAEITVTVPVTITNANGYKAAKVTEQIDFDVNIPTMPQFISAGTMAEGTGAVVPGLPSLLQPNDIMLLFVETANEAVSTPSGWAAVADSPQGITTTRLTVFWKRATGADTAPTVADPGDHAIAQILSFRYCVNTGDPWDVTSGNTGASSTSVSIPGDTTTVVNTLVVVAVSNATDSATAQTSGFTNADLANLTELVDVNTSQGNGGGFAVAAGQKASIGAYVATTATLANASEQGRISIALKPALTTWSATIGSINSTSGLFTAPTLAGPTARITATNGLLINSIDIDILETFPLNTPILPVSWDRNLTALISMSEDRKRRVTRDKSPSFDSYEVKFVSRTLAEMNSVDAFFDSHGFGKLFIFDDAVRGIRKVGWFDSPIRHEGKDECDHDLSFRFLEARL